MELSKAQQAAFTHIRAQLTIPADLDTDFNLQRWWQAYNGDVDAMVEKFGWQIANRRAAGLECLVHDVNTFWQLPIVKQVSGYLSMSAEFPINTRDNSIVFVEGCIPEPHKLVKQLTVSDYLRFFHASCEFFTQLILRQEATTGKPSHGTCIYDMTGNRLMGHVNPLAAINRLLLARVLLWQEYYGELLHKVIIVNGPSGLGILWRLVSNMVNKKYHTRFVFIAKHEQLLDHLVAACIPAAFGGTWTGQSEHCGTNTAACCNVRRTMDDSTFRQTGDSWRAAGYSGDVPASPGRSLSLPAHQTKDIEVEVGANQRLLWLWRTSGELEFSVLRKANDDNDSDDQARLVYPMLKLATPKLMEEGCVACPTAGTYCLRFTNHGSFYAATVHYETAVIDNQ